MMPIRLMIQFGTVVAGGRWLGQMDDQAAMASARNAHCVDRLVDNVNRCDLQTRIVNINIKKDNIEDPFQ